MCSSVDSCAAASVVDSPATWLRTDATRRGHADGAHTSTEQQGEYGGIGSRVTADRHGHAGRTRDVDDPLHLAQHARVAASAGVRARVGAGEPQRRRGQVVAADEEKSAT